MKRGTHAVLSAALAGLVLVMASLAGLADATYDIRVSLDAEAHTLLGSERVTIVNDTESPASSLRFALIGNWGAEPNPYLDPALTDSQYVSGFDPTWTRIYAVADDGGDALAHRLEPAPPVLQTYSLDESFLVVELASPLASGAATTVEIEFETKFAEGLLLDNCLYRDTYVWRFGWNPVYVPEAIEADQFAMPTAMYRVELTVPEDWSAFGGAARQVDLGTTASLTTTAFENDRPTRSVPLLIGRDLRTVSSEWNGLPLVAVTPPELETFARLALSYAVEILESHAANYGPFGYERLVIATVPTPGLFGMAADGMVLVGSDIATEKDMPAAGLYDRLIDYLLAHEIAHLWWGIGIGTDFNAENWISEGFAEYLSISYFESKYGEFEPNLFSHLGGGLVEDLVADTFGHFNLRQHMSELPYLETLKLDFDEELVKPATDVEYLNVQNVRIYNKGYLVLRALEGLIGEDAMRELLREANTEWFGKMLTVDAFREMAEAMPDPGNQVSALFEDWVLGAAQLDVAVDGFDVASTNDGFTTTVQLRRTGSSIPVTIEAVMADGSTARATWISNEIGPDAPPASIAMFDTPTPVVAIRVDPDEMTPDANRFNNHWPRKILVEHPFRDDDAGPIGQPLDAYVIEISPMGISGSFRNDHAWSLMALPHIDPDLDLETADEDELLKMLMKTDVVGMFVANVSRDLSIAVQGSLTGVHILEGGGELDLLATASLRRFTHPQIGSPGQYWLSSDRIDVSFGAIGELPSVLPFVSLTLAHSALPRHVAEQAVTFTAGIPGLGTPSFATAEWTGFTRLRLGHLLYLDIALSAGSGVLAELPDEFLFSLGAMRAFPYPPTGHHEIYGEASLVLPPLVRDLGYAIFNLTRIEDVSTAAFVRAGRTWGGCTRVCESGIRVEAGMEFRLVTSAILGQRLSFAIGYAHPLVGPDGEGAFYVDFGAAP